MQKWLLVFLLFVSLQVAAQEKKEIKSEDYKNYSVEMADQMREDGKIYVLVGIIAIVMGGLLFYVVSTDKKISRLEREFRE
ncbi:CcmD family protein [Echinicola jeungdonensis]|uniref:CcmD family protein n=1 Tax=Echinicola jeungdonensis TaxID=709343 RepID=A0ABV5J4W6_9BACT|nr:CcmD family protein [Echinicola jeungdonensis]MDN3668808.1 CcmD family protein [Echinicola jeungdonensis]